MHITFISFFLHRGGFFLIHWCGDREIELSTPRDRGNTFEPQLIKKNQTRITQMDSQILSLCAKGMTTREIVATFKE